MIFRYVSAALAVLLAASVVAAVFFRGSAISDRARADAAEQRAEGLAQALAASERARQQEHAKAEALAAVAAQYEREKLDAEAKADAVAAAMRADTLRLREHWRGCETNRVSEAAARAAEPDAAAELRAEGASDLVRVAAEADAQVRGLQEVIREDRVISAQRGD